MPEAKPFELRIYCLCGQKMKVSSDSLGKPGKCVACRQKIRIPSETELGPDELVIHLKDRPEFLRKPGRAPSDLAEVNEESRSEQERDDVLLGGDSGQLAAVAFERFEPIRKLCNYEHAVRAQLQCIREGRPVELDKATLMSYRGLARQARQQLEGSIRDELISVAAELQDNRDSLTALQIALKTGDVEHVAYSKSALPLRKRREVLVYRQQNLRGWLATEDPHMAGGLDDVSLADVPMDLANGTFPLDDEISGLPIENAVSRLERALRDRERSDKLLNELHRMGLDGIITVDELGRRRADTEAERQRTRTAVAFYRGRLEQVIQDCEEDSKALKKYQDFMASQLKSAAIAQDVFRRLEEAICRTQVDVKRARNMASRALNANAVSDVPNPHGTFLERLASPGVFRGLGADSWLAWGGSSLLIGKILIPVASQTPGGVASAFTVPTVALFLLATLAGVAATIVVRPVRGIVLNILWLALTLVGALYLRRSLGGDGSVFDDSWWRSLSGILSVSGWIVLGMAACWSLMTVGRIRWLAVANLIGGTAIALVLLSDFFGLFKPQPQLGTPRISLLAASGTYDVQVPVANNGHADFWIGGNQASHEATASYLLEYKVGANSWADAGAPLWVDVAGNKAEFSAAMGLAVAPDGEAVFGYELPPGIYRLQLIPAWRGIMAQRHTFQLDPPPPVVSPASGVDLNATPPPTPSAPKGVDIELKGVLDAKASSPIFSVVIHQSDGTERQLQFQIGDTVHGEWIISEYNPAHNTITLTKGERLVVVERGTIETLD